MVAAGGTVAGLVLAAGAGRRMGTPKALLRDPDGTPWPARAAAALTAAGCEPVVVVVGAAAEEARTALAEAGTRLRTVVAADWAEGMGASLRAGLAALADEPVDAVLVTLVDLPDVGVPVVRRILDSWRAGGQRRDDLVRASYGGRPGHPVLLGRAHWPALLATLAGDEGAATYLARHKVRSVSCEDLATGRDVDRP